MNQIHIVRHDGPAQHFRENVTANAPDADPSGGAHAALTNSCPALNGDAGRFVATGWTAGFTIKPGPSKKPRRRSLRVTFLHRGRSGQCPATQRDTAACKVEHSLRQLPH